MLELDWTTVAFEIVNFLVLTALLYRFLFRPVMRSVKRRADEKARLVRDMEADRGQAAAARLEWETRLAQAQQEAEDMLNQAREQLEEQRTELIRLAQAEVEHILAEAHLDALRTRQQAIEDFHQELVETILEISGWGIACVAPAELHDELVSQMIERIWNMGLTDVQQLEAIRRSLRERAPQATVTTAQPLSPEQIRQLNDTLDALVDRSVKMDVVTDPGLILGLRMRLGDVMIDNSMEGQLSDLSQEVSKTILNRLQTESPDLAQRSTRALSLAEVRG